MRLPFILSIRRDERGATMIEYAFLIGIIGIGIASSVSILEEEISAIFDPASAAYHQVQCERLLADSDLDFAMTEAENKGLTCDWQENSEG